MSARILILDTVATNRIMLKVKMLAAGFAIDASPNVIEAERVIAAQFPDLILICISEQNSAERAFCTKLRNTPATSGVPIIVIGVADTSQARFAALDAGADDVMPHPVHDSLLLARIRSLLRTRSAPPNFDLHKSTGRALGFDDAKTPFASAVCRYWVTQDPARNQTIIAEMSKAIRHTLRTLDFASARTLPDASQRPDLLIVDATDMTGKAEPIVNLMAELRARAGTRHAAQLILAPPKEPDHTALFLDIGADDVAPANCGANELAHRARVLLERSRASIPQAMA